MILRQLFDEKSWTYSYIIADENSRDAVIIDPVLDQIERDLALMKELELNLKYSLDTHIHADHISANGKLREITRCQTALAHVADVSCANLALKDNDNLALGALDIKVIATPGHTNACLSFLIGNHLFTGDALFIRGCGRTDFQQGSADKLYHSVTEKLFSLPDNTWVHPGHDYHGQTLSTIGEEKAHNPRFNLGHQQFISFMDNLDLAKPGLIMEAVPANQGCGKIVPQ